MLFIILDALNLPYIFTLGWEPFAEPWTTFLSWQQQAASRLHPPRLKLDLQAKQRLDINITSVLMGKESSVVTGRQSLVQALC